MTCPSSILIMRTYDPTARMIQRIKDMWKLSTNTKWILSIHLSRNSFLSEPNTGINNIDCDTDCYSSFDELMINAPKFIKKRNTCFVKTNMEINGATRTVSEETAFYRLKPNIIELVDTFNNIDNFSIHFYTDMQITQRFGDLPKCNGRSLAWNFHNECVALTLEDIFGVTSTENTESVLPISDDCKIWIFEDDVEYTGNIGDFLKINEAKNFDLLGARSYMEQKRQSVG